MRGLSSAMARFNALPNRVEAAAREAALAAAQETAARAQAGAPVRTGALRASLAFSSTEAGAETTARCAYAGFLEWGTRFCPARPFLLPAALGADYFTRAARAIEEAVK